MLPIWKYCINSTQLVGKKQTIHILTKFLKEKHRHYPCLQLPLKMKRIWFIFEKMFFCNIVNQIVTIWPKQNKIRHFFLKILRSQIQDVRVRNKVLVKRRLASRFVGVPSYFEIYTLDTEKFWIEVTPFALQKKVCFLFLLITQKFRSKIQIVNFIIKKRISTIHYRYHSSLQVDFWN